MSFAYNPLEDPERLALREINCTIPLGKITALVGPSGGGKTTIARLIPRFWDVSSGKVTIGGTNVKDFAEIDLLKSVTVVFQDASLMNASISENIALSKPEADKEAIGNAAKAALIHDRIMELPMGYDSIIGQGEAMFSGGEKQRIAIARAFLADAPILILDEATAQADAESEAQIQAALSSLRQGKTVIIIAHRLQTIVDADQILVVDSGKIVQSGKHHILVEEQGIYQSMWQAQNGLV